MHVHPAFRILPSAFFLAVAASASVPAIAPLRIVPEGGFEAGKLYEVDVRYPTNRSETVSFTTGRSYSWIGKGRNGSPVTNTAVRRVDITMGGQPGNVSFTPNHTSGSQRPETYRLNAALPEQTFATMDDPARAQEAAAERERRDWRREKLRLGVRLDPGFYRLFANGAFVCSLPREEGDLPGFAFPSALFADNRLRVSESDPRWESVDISERANAGGFGRRLAPAGTVTNIAGVPFLLSTRGNDAIDLFQSRFASAIRTGMRGNRVSERWPDPLAKTPLRFSFRVPGGDYDALCVLCAADGSRRDAIPRLTAQFYHPGVGRPFSCASGDVPVSTNGAVHVVTIPLPGDLFTELGTEGAFALELTKGVQPYRVYPDPYYFSEHAAGLPSSVRVLGVSLRRPEVKVAFDPDEPANAFTEGQKVAYTATLENTTAAPREERLVFTATSWDGQKTVRQEKAVRLAPGERKAVGFSFAPQRYGWHAVSLAAAGRDFHHNAAYLKARDYTRRPFDHKGMRFGTWTVFKSPERASLLGKAGFDSGEGLPANASPELRDIWDRYGFAFFSVPGNARGVGKIVPGDDFETNVVRFTQAWGGARMGDPGSENWKYTRCLVEPGGIGTGNAQFPEYYGEPTNAFDYARLQGTEKARYEDYKERVLVGVTTLKRLYPQARHLVPNGSWTFLLPFLQDPETRPLFDGVKCDFQFFNHIPEEQIYETSIHSLWYFRKAWAKYRPDKEPFLLLGEGPDIHQVYPGGSTMEEDAALRIRDSIHLAGYGIDWQLSWGTDPFSSEEHHCSGGLAIGARANDPTWGYCAMATWTRLTRDATFESYSPVGSRSAFCANFRDHKTGKLLRAIWTVRGRRTFSFPCKPGALTVLDPMDNEVAAAAGPDGTARLTVGQMPFFVLGADAVAPTVAGDPDHSDDALAEGAVPLGSFAEHFAGQAADDEDRYLNTMADYIRRFPAAMEVVATNDAAHGPVLSVGLPKQETDRMVMPYYTCLHFRKPVEIPGKAAALRVDVKAASDWGRVVFVVKDASGRRFYSCGQKDQWNADDMTGQSFFNFDGWRRLRIELPSNAPWDCFREAGFASWGSDAPKEPVALPLAIEKVFVERRGGIMYGNDYLPFDRDTPVLLGALHAEYASEADKGAEAIRLSKLRLPTTPATQLPNPLAEMASNPLPAGRIVSVKDPATWFDGTNGDFAFELPEEAVSWDLWVAPSKDGRGALKLGNALKKNPCNVSGFLAGQTFHAFLVWRDKAGNLSKPSEPLEFKLEDHFAHQ